MPYTEQKPAGPAKILSLSAREVLFSFSWGALGGALLLPFTDSWFLGIPVAVLVSVYFLAAMETAEETGPLLALDLRQYSPRRKRDVSLRSTYLRILFTLLFFPPLMLSCVTLLFKKRSLPELVTGIRITETDHRYDPRPVKVIDEIRKSSRNRLKTLSIVPLAVSAAVFAVNHSAPEVVMLQDKNTPDNLPQQERELLIHYLEMTTLHPQELEYHVRLASLYYRNGMEQDLQEELNTIREIDPEHAILLLADTAAIGFQMIEPLPGDSSPADLISLPPVGTAADSASTADSLNADSLSSPADTMVIEPDTLSPSGLAVMPEATSSSPDTSSLETQDDLTESIGTTEEDITSSAEEALEPDPIVQP